MRIQVVSKPTVVSLFAGCGGSSLGYKMAGYEERLAVEWDDNAAETFRLNFPEVSLFHGDIAVLSDAEALRLTNLSPGVLDVLDGSPPCQGFSTAGNRKLGDVRNKLFQEYIRLLRVFKPRALVMENVPGLITGHMKGTYLEILKELRDAGYRAAGAVLNAADYGVPQLRRRVIIIGLHEDVSGEITFPIPTVKKHVTVAEALGYSGTGALSYLPAPALTGKALTVAASLRAGERPKGEWFSSHRLPVNTPSPTILKEGALWKKYPHVIHPVELRGLSIGELRRISSFPDEFRFAGI